MKALSRIPYPRLLGAILLANACGAIFAISMGIPGCWGHSITLPVCLFIVSFGVLPGYACMTKPRPPIPSALLVPVVVLVWQMIAFSPHRGLHAFVTVFMWTGMSTILGVVVASLAVSIGLSAILDRRRGRDVQDTWFLWGLVGVLYFGILGFFGGDIAVHQLDPPRNSLGDDFGYAESIPSQGIGILLAFVGFTVGALLYRYRKRSICEVVVAWFRRGNVGMMCGAVIGAPLGALWKLFHPYSNFPGAQEVVSSLGGTIPWPVMYATVPYIMCSVTGGAVDLPSGWRFIGED